MVQVTRTGDASNDATPAPLPLPIIVGITGHRDIDPMSDAQIRSVTSKILSELRSEFGDALHVMTALADGADQLVADVASSLSLPIIAVLPMPLSAYRLLVSDTSRLDAHWNNAAIRIELPMLGEISDTASKTDQHQYEQLGVFLSQRSHILLVLWEGPERCDPRGADIGGGGTVDVLRMRFDVQYALKSARNSLLFERFGSQLSLPHPDPVIHVVAPRVHRPATTERFKGYVPPPGNCYILKNWSGLDGIEIKPTDEIRRHIPAATKKDLDQIKNLNDRLAKLPNFDMEHFKAQFAYLQTSDETALYGEPLEKLKCLQAGVDAAATVHQRQLFGVNAPSRFHLRFGLLFWTTAIVPISVLMFEWYAKLHGGMAPLAIYLTMMVASILVERDAFDKRHLHERFLDYRTLAEAIRVQMFWAASALPAASADNYSRKQVNEIGWIASALRGPAMLGASAALASLSPDRRAVLHGWIGSQTDFFVGTDEKSGRAMQNLRAATSNKRFARIFLWLGITTAGILLTRDILENVMPHDQTQILSILEIVGHKAEFIDVFAVLCPAIASFFTSAAAIWAYRAHAYNYLQMGKIFNRALSVASSIPAPGQSEYEASDDLAFKELVHDLGREALSENIEWFISRRGQELG